MKRLASRLNTGLVAHAVGDKPQFWFGIPPAEKAKELSSRFYSARKELAAYRDLSAKNVAQIAEWDFTCYEVLTDRFLNIGDEVNFDGKKLLVCQSSALMEDGVLRLYGVLAPQNGLKQGRILNRELSGVSLDGSVVSVKNDQVQVQLEIDSDTKLSHWFPYSSPYTSENNTGWHCMPEKGERPDHH